MVGGYVKYDYGTGAASTASSYIAYDCGTATNTAIEIEYGYADCTATSDTNSVWIPLGRKVRNHWTAATSCSTCAWETVEDDCGVMWEGWGASQTVLKVRWSSYGKPVKLTPEELAAQRERQLKSKISQIIQSRCAPNAIVRNSKRQPLPMPADIREERARETLRRVVGDQKFVNYVKHGFITVKARSGLVYQIFSGHGITCVFDQGKLVERLCVVLQGNFPPTDSLIMRYILILNNEQQFRSFAIKHSVEGYNTGRSRLITGQAEVKPLAEIFKELKQRQVA